MTHNHIFRIFEDGLHSCLFNTALGSSLGTRKARMSHVIQDGAENKDSYLKTAYTLSTCRMLDHAMRHDQRQLAPSQLRSNLICTGAHLL